MTPERKAYLLGLTTYPQMTPIESAIVRQWLTRHADAFDDVDFNVRVGNSIDLGAGYDDSTRKLAELSSQKRVDVVGYKGSEVTMVEAKPRLSLSALGQLLGYSVLWQAEHPESTAVHLVAIGQSALVDAQEVFGAHGITTELFPEVA